jgi:hypothetical protein
MTGRQGFTIGAIKRRVLLWRWWHEREAEHWTNHDAARSIHAHPISSLVGNCARRGLLLA